jgi:membrane-bound inhibitor of C-type lysozyme
VHKIFTLFLVVGLCACSSLSIVDDVVAYDCGDFRVTSQRYKKQSKGEYSSCFDNGCVNVFLFGRECNSQDNCVHKKLDVMESIVSASGSKFKSKKHQVVFWSKESNAFVENRDGSLYNCTIHNL